MTRTFAALRPGDEFVWRGTVTSRVMTIEPAGYLMRVTTQRMPCAPGRIGSDTVITWLQGDYPTHARPASGGYVYRTEGD